MPAPIAPDPDALDKMKRLPTRAWVSIALVLGTTMLNAFNDNLLKMMLVGLAPKVAAGALGQNIGVWLGAMILLPFILFAPLSGFFADRYSKRSVILAMPKEMPMPIAPPPSGDVTTSLPGLVGSTFHVPPKELPPDGSFAQFCKVQARQLMKRPQHLTWEESASYTLTLATAYRMLFGHRPHILRPGHNVLVWGAAGGIGSMAVQLIAAAGASRALRSEGQLARPVAIARHSQVVRAPHVRAEGGGQVHETGRPGALGDPEPGQRVLCLPQRTRRLIAKRLPTICWRFTAQRLDSRLQPFPGQSARIIKQIPDIVVQRVA